MIGQSEFRKKDHCWPPSHRAFAFGDAVEVLPAWHGGTPGMQRGRIIGWYKTKDDTEGYCVESAHPSGGVLVFPARALRFAGWASAGFGSSGA